MRRRSAPSPHLALTTAQGPTPCRCPRWQASSHGGHAGVSGILSGRRGPGTWSTGSCHQQYGCPEPSHLLSPAWGQLGIAAPHSCGHGKPVSDCGNWVLLLAQPSSGAAQLQPRRARRTAIAASFLATLGLPVRGPGAVATSKRTARWRWTLQEASRWHDSPESARRDHTCPLRSRERCRQPEAERDGCCWVGSGAGGCSPGVRAGGDGHRGGTTGGHRRAETAERRENVGPWGCTLLPVPRTSGRAAAFLARGEGVIRRWGSVGQIFHL